MEKVIRSILFGCCFLLSCTLIGQDHFNYLSARFNYGSILIHSRDLRPFQDSYPIGIELDFGRHTTSQKAWDNCNCFPRSGVSVTFWDFDNREVLGFGVTTMYYL